MPEHGTCKLCLKKKDLQESHYMPSALYPPRNGQFEYTTPVKIGRSAEHSRQYLLCHDCEQRFNRHGESEVLRAIAPKSMKRFPLHEQMRLAPPRESDSSVSRFAGYEFGLDMDKFAYFTLSVVWRAMVIRWTKPDGTLTSALELGGFEEPIRRYLLGETPFPPDTAVIVIVCSDDESRKAWYPPAPFVEANCLNFRFLARGVCFRAMMGRHLPEYFRESCCASPRKCIFYANLERKTREVFATLSD